MSSYIFVCPASVTPCAPKQKRPERYAWVMFSYHSSCVATVSRLVGKQISVCMLVIEFSIYTDIHHKVIDVLVVGVVFVRRPPFPTHISTRQLTLV